MEIKAITGERVRGRLERDFDVIVPPDNHAFQIYNALVLELFGRIKKLEERIKGLEDEPS